MNLNGKEIFEKTKFSIVDINAVEGSKSLVTYKIILKYDGRQFTTTYDALVGKQLKTEEVMIELLENYNEYFYLSDFNNNKGRYSGFSKDDLDSLYKKCKKIKTSLERLYGIKDFNKVLNYFNK